MIPDSFAEPIAGLQFWTNQNHIRVCRLHYSADPMKTPEWVEKASVKYPGGIKGSSWQMEMEINPYAYAGSLVYPDFSIKTHVIEPWALPGDWPAFRAIDPGFANPFACVWVRVSPDGTFYVYREHYKSRWTLDLHCSAIKGLTGHEEIDFTVIDPIAANESLSSEHTVQDQIAEHGIFTIPGINDVEAGITAVNALMRIQENGQPRVKVFSTCERFIDEHRNYRYQLLTDKQKTMKNISERPMKVNDHTCDAFRYLVMAVPPGYCSRHGIHATPEQRSLNAHERILARIAHGKGWDDGF